MQDESRLNKARQAKQKDAHTAGSKSYASHAYDIVRTLNFFL